MTLGGSEPGERRGGRQKGSVNKATAGVRSLAQEHGAAAIEELARLSTQAENENARIAACNALLDRAYGRSLSSRPIEIDIPDTSSIDGVAKAVAVVIQSAADGQITPAEASDFCALLETQRRVIELSDVEQRLARLEAGPAHGNQR